MINNTLPPVNRIFDNLPYYLSYIEWYRTQGGNYAIRAFGSTHPDNKNPPKNTPRIYIKPGDFPWSENEKELSFWIQHRLRYYTLKIEGYYDYNELVRNCRPFVDTYKEVLSRLGKEWNELYPGYKTDRLLVSMLKYAIRREIPEFPIF